jgi:hypothetical protein
MKLFIFLFIISSSVLAQTLGNPGGGGPDGDSPEQICFNHQKKVDELETKFIKYWNKFKFGTTNNLIPLKEIEMELVIARLIKFEPIEKIDLGRCIYLVKNDSPYNRSTYKEELRLLDDLILDIENNLNINICHYFSVDIRKQHLEQLKSIRNYYGP